MGALADDNRTNLECIEEAKQSTSTSLVPTREGSPITQIRQKYVALKVTDSNKPSCDQFVIR